MLPVKPRLNAALASKDHPAQTAHLVTPAKTVLPERDPALQDPLVATQSSTNVSCPSHRSALARLPAVQLVPPAHLVQMAVPATRAATDAMETTAHRAQLDPLAQPDHRATPERRDPLENPAPFRLVPSHHRAHPAVPVVQVLPDLPERPAPPARMATTVLQASLVSPVSAVLPAATASPDPLESQELLVPPAAATTAHRLVSPQDINFPSLPTTAASVHLGWLLVLFSIYTTSNSFR